MMQLNIFNKLYFNKLSSEYATFMKDECGNFSAKNSSK